MYIHEINSNFLLTNQGSNGIVRLNAPIVQENGVYTELPLRFQKDHFFCFENGKDRVELTVENRGEGLFYIQRNWKNISPNRRKIQTVFGVTPCFAVEKYLIPCVSVNGNTFGNGLEPKGIDLDGQPWIFSYDRVSIPSCTLTENKDYSVALFVSHESTASLESACSVRKHESTGLMTQEIYHPVIESPKTYCTRDGYCEKQEGYLTLREGEVFRSGFYLLISKPRWRHYGVAKLLDVALTLFPTESAMMTEARAVWDYSIRFAKSLLTEYHGKKGFIIGFLPNDEGGFSYRDDHYFELAWCGQNVLLSRMLIKDYMISGNRESLDCAIEVLDTRVKYCVSSQGLLASQLKDYEHLNESVSDVCNMGYGAYEFLRTYELLKELGIDKTEYLQAGLGVCNFFMTHFSVEYGFGKAWRLDGVCVDQGGSIGAFMIPALAQAYKLTRAEQYLAMAERAMEFYMERDLNQFYCTAGALDTCCVDKETSSPFLMGAVLLYELTGKHIYLTYGEKAAYYFTSWMFQYQPHYENHDDIEAYGVRVQGMTAVSAQHHHLDVYAALVVPYLRKLAGFTGDLKWEIRADWMWRASLQCVGDGELSIHGKRRPIGSQNEAVFQCNWTSEGAARGSLNDWLVAWPCAFRLSVLAEEL